MRKRCAMLGRELEPSELKVKSNPTGNSTLIPGEGRRRACSCCLDAQLLHGCGLVACKVSVTPVTLLHLQSL